MLNAFPPCSAEREEKTAYFSIYHVSMLIEHHRPPWNQPDGCPKTTSTAILPDQLPYSPYFASTSPFTTTTKYKRQAAAILMFCAIPSLRFLSTAELHKLWISSWKEEKGNFQIQNPFPTHRLLLHICINIDPLSFMWRICAQCLYQKPHSVYWSSQSQTLLAHPALSKNITPEKSFNCTKNISLCTFS